MAVVVPPGFYDADTRIPYSVSRRIIVAATTQPQLILPEALNRLGAVIKNYDVSNVYIGGKDQDLHNDGHILAPGDAIAITSGAAVYGVVGAGGVGVSTFEELLR